MSAMTRSGIRVHVTAVNGQPGMTVTDTQDRPVGVIALDIASARMQTIHSIASPDELRPMDQAGYLGAQLHKRCQQAPRVSGRGGG
jgi:RNA polymerase sigma-70 factor (ECF subfamily)